MEDLILSAIPSVPYLTHPLDQFEISTLIFYWSGSYLPAGATIVTNLTVILSLNVLLIRFLFAAIYDRGNFNTMELTLYQTYNLVKSIVKSNTSSKRYQYFTILFYLFIFILVANMVGLIPYSFTSTSSFVITFFIASSHFIGTNIIGITATQWRSLGILLPGGVPLLIAPFLIIIELVSYIAKVFSLSIRLFANMMSGHALLKILIGFSWTLIKIGSVLLIIALIPWLLVTAIFFLESLISFLQAYVFVILSTIYINDVLMAH